MTKEATDSTKSEEGICNDFEGGTGEKNGVIKLSQKKVQEIK